MYQAYEKVPTGEDGTESVQYTRLPPRKRLIATARRVAFSPWMIHAILILINALLLIMTLWADQEVISRCNSESSTWDPSLVGLSRKPVKFDGSWKVGAESRYGGPPRPALDEAWDRFTTNRWVDGTAVVLSVSEEDIAKARKIDDPAWFNTTVKLDDEQGGYMATIDMFHQLHCLNMIRKAVHRDYYESRTTMFQTREFWDHIDHCFQTIRQSLMCTGNTELITFHWVKDWAGPVPDFHVWHQCRDAEEILEWANDREAHITSPIRKGSGVVELQERP